MGITERVGAGGQGSGHMQVVIANAKETDAVLLRAGSRKTGRRGRI
jgi:hypothetical protein